MTERTERQIEIVNEMLENALISAREFERECEAFAERQTADEMADVIDELSEWIEERDSHTLEDFGIAMEEDLDGRLLFRLADKDEPFVVRLREDMTIAAGWEILHLDPDLPILDEDVYAEVMERLLIWAGVSEAKPRKRFGF